MGFTVIQSQSDANQRDVPIYLEKPDGTAYTGSTSGFTITFKPPGGSDTNYTSHLSDDGSGRKRMALQLADIASTGIGWIHVADPNNAILEYVDWVAIGLAPADLSTVLTDVVSLLSSMSTSLSNEGTLLTNVSTILSRLPSALDGSGNIKAAVQSIVNNAITAASIATGAVDADAIADGAIDAAAIADGAFTTAKFVDGVFTAAKFASGAFAAVGGVVTSAVVYGSRTIKGILKRADRINIGKATGLDSATATFYDEDGTTPVVAATQDTGAGTRQAASTAAGD